MPRLLLLAPIPTVLLGAFVMRQAGVPDAAWGQNLAATAVGAGFVLAARAWPGATPPSTATRRILAWGVVALLGATLLQSGMEGVHRWISLGPMKLHAGAMFLPSLLVLLARRDRGGSLAVALVALCILWLQPDAAQATALAIAWSVGEAMSRGRGAAPSIAVALLLAMATAFRADPLPPVAHVEGIVGLAARQGTAWSVAGLMALTLPIVAWLCDTERRTGAALAAYIAGTLVARWLGNFPVPYFGFGVSPIRGYYAAVALVERMRESLQLPTRLPTECWRGSRAGQALARDVGTASRDGRAVKSR